MFRAEAPGLTVSSFLAVHLNTAILLSPRGGGISQELRREPLGARAIQGQTEENAHVSLCDSVFVWLLWLFLFFLNAMRVEAGEKPVLRTSKDKERGKV